MQSNEIFLIIFCFFFSLLRIFFFVKKLKSLWKTSKNIYFIQYKSFSVNKCYIFSLNFPESLENEQRYPLQNNPSGNVYNLQLLFYKNSPLSLQALQCYMIKNWIFEMEHFYNKEFVDSDSSSIIRWRDMKQKREVIYMCKETSCLANVSCFKRKHRQRKTQIYRFCELIKKQERKSDRRNISMESFF